MAGVSETQFYVPLVGEDVIAEVRDTDAGTTQPFILGYHDPISPDYDAVMQWITPWAQGDYGGPQSPAQAGSYTKKRAEGRTGNAMSIIETVMSARVESSQTPLCDLIIIAYKAPSGIQGTLPQRYSTSNPAPANGQSGYDLSRSVPIISPGSDQIAQNGPTAYSAYLAALQTTVDPALPEDAYEMPMVATPTDYPSIDSSVYLGHLPSGYRGSLNSFLTKALTVLFGGPPPAGVLPNLSISEAQIGETGLHFAAWSGEFGENVSPTEFPEIYAGSALLSADFTHSFTR